MFATLKEYELGYNENELLEVLREFDEVMDVNPGETDVIEMKNEVEQGTRVISQTIQGFVYVYFS